jgi:hypothetical protein
METGKVIFTTVNGKRLCLAKHVGNTITRELPFKQSVLWKTKSFSFNKKLLDYAKQNDVEKFIFADLEKKNYVQIGMDAMIQEGSEDDYGYGLNWYVPMSAGVELDTYEKAPYFDKKESIVIL